MLRKFNRSNTMEGSHTDKSNKNRKIDEFAGDGIKDFTNQETQTMSIFNMDRFDIRTPSETK